MKFDESEGYEITYNRTTLVWDDKQGICADCAEPTHWYDINMSQYLCSDVCVSRVWQHYMETIG